MKKAAGAGGAIRSAAGFYKVVGDDLRQALLYWADRKVEYLREANMQFIGFTDPALIYGKGPLLEKRDIEQMFSEWALFDFRRECGRTLLESYLERNPQELGDASRGRLEQVAATQFTGQFAIQGKDPDAGRVTLADCASGRVYNVIDPKVSRVGHWRRGSIVERIARVGGAWVHVGITHFYDRAPIDGGALPRPAAAGGRHTRPGMAADEPRHDPMTYLTWVRDLIGISGRHRSTTRVRHDLDGVG